MSSLGRTFQITPEEMREIHARLTPHFPPYLRAIEPNPHGWGLSFAFEPFTGREPEPCTPRSFYNDPQLSFSESNSETEYLLREKAGVVMSNLYEAAREKWKKAAYVADLRDVVKDAPHRWTRYVLASQELEEAYAYLRTSDAATEWPAAISRLVDAQDCVRAEASAFDERAADIADVHYRHLYAELTHIEALTRAGYPEAKDWHVGDGFGGHFTGGLTQKADHQIKEQEAHLSRVSRLAGLTA
ncbi:hypothetical protein ACQ9AR_33415 [Streptomyces lividans]|uniref:Uncharacterized protein n=2 Tax=Streptomyces lividans TaxID=1916 RepID=Q848E5_STRLI|nr:MULTISPECIES: hypothetical protein [Streptomyces]AAO61169.1 hypothetical protein [Streptomyces lividans 1326]KKD10997.1 hypothetical protein TR66_33350 [Streptomyces sp. WM6391]